MRVLLKGVLIVIVAVGVFVAALFVLANFVLPILPEEQQTALVQYGSAVITAIAVLAALAQVTGFSLKDLFKAPHTPHPLDDPDRIAPASSGISTMLSMQADHYGSISIAGDVLQHGSTKMLIGGQPEISPTHPRKTVDVEWTIREIQAKLYSKNAELPYILTLCLDLCATLGINDDNVTWLEKELSGFRNYAQLQSSFDDVAHFDAWMEKWASHRLVATYMKFRYRSSDRGGQFVLDDLPFERIFVAYRLNELVSLIEQARNNRAEEVFFPLQNFPEETLQSLSELVSKHFGGSQIPPDLQVFIRLQQLERILEGTRDKILGLLRLVREHLSGTRK